jgi:CheY-like chemotaxis protein
MSTPESTPTPTYTALIVDDNYYNRDIFRIALENVGYSVSDCADGEQGAALLTTRTFDVLILDLQMPGLDGRTVLLKVHENPLHRSMRIVVVTANAHMATDDVGEIADYVMIKPINVMEFSEFTRRLKPATVSTAPVTTVTTESTISPVSATPTILATTAPNVPAAPSVPTVPTVSAAPAMPAAPTKPIGPTVPNAPIGNE